MAPNYTPFANMTDSELILVVANNAEATPLEIELALRVEKLAGEVEGLIAEAVNAGVRDPDIPKVTHYVGDE